MKYILKTMGWAGLVTFFLAGTASAQNIGWLSGWKTFNVSPTYSMDAPSPQLNSPGTRADAVTWVDADDNLWLWGGFNQTPQLQKTRYADLWHFDVKTGVWRWVNGPSGDIPDTVHGIFNTTGSANLLGNRVAPANWIDTAGNLYVFGGAFANESDPADTLYNDLWKYNATEHQWSWIGGSNAANQPSHYDTVGVPAITNAPGARKGAAFWKTADGLFWLFGGFGYDEFHNLGMLNDLWSYNPETAQWTLEDGSTIRNSPGVYGAQYLPHPSNNPGGRSGAGIAQDAAGNVWLFGGTGYNRVSELGLLDDLWKWERSTGLWTWMGGHDRYMTEQEKFGTAVEPEIYHADNNPSARQSGNLWFNADGELYLSGGTGTVLLSSGIQPSVLSDIWKFNPINNRWAYIRGSLAGTDLPVYGQKGVPSTGNHFGGVTLTRPNKLSDGNYLLFGGLRYDRAAYPALNLPIADLWKMTTPEKDIVGSLVSGRTRITEKKRTGITTNVALQISYNDVKNTGLPAIIAAAYIVDSPIVPIQGQFYSAVNSAAIKEPKPGKLAKAKRVKFNINYSGDLTGKYIAVQLDALHVVDEKAERNNVVFYGPITAN